jgi:hypothetical protein
MDKYKLNNKMPLICGKIIGMKLLLFEGGNYNEIDNCNCSR